jgi:hypothetical protein
MGNNNDPIGGNELAQMLFNPSPEVSRVASAILGGLSPDVSAPVGIAALTFALAEAIIVNTSPPQAWAEVIATRLRTAVAAYPKSSRPTAAE